MSQRTKTVIVCDRCQKADVPGTSSHFIQTGWNPCTAESIATPSGRTIDLCPACMSEGLAWFTTEISLRINRRFLEEVVGCKG